MVCANTHRKYVFGSVLCEVLGHDLYTHTHCSCSWVCAKYSRHTLIYQTLELVLTASIALCPRCRRYRHSLKCVVLCWFVNDVSHSNFYLHILCVKNHVGQFLQRPFCTLCFVFVYVYFTTTKLVLRFLLLLHPGGFHTDAISLSMLMAANWVSRKVHSHVRCECGRYEYQGGGWCLAHWHILSGFVGHCASDVLWRPFTVVGIYDIWFMYRIPCIQLYCTRVTSTSAENPIQSMNKFSICCRSRLLFAWSCKSIYTGHL